MNTSRGTRNSADLILQEIYTRGQVTRAELGEATGLSLTTILRLVSELRDRDLIVESRDTLDGNGRGRSPHAQDSVELPAISGISWRITSRPA